MTRGGFSHYCLRGKIKHSDRSFTLRYGENIAGSLRSNEIVISAPGVSREHARLTLQGSDLLIEDLESKNGTFVNSLRVEKSQARPGDEIRLGPVKLRFEEIHKEDAKLAFTFEDLPLDHTSGSRFNETPLLTTGLGSAVSRRWLRITETLVQWLPRHRSEDLNPAVGKVVEQLELEGACVLEIPPHGRNPVVLAASGNIDGPSTQAIQGLIQPQFGPGSPPPEVLYEARDPAEGPPITFGVLSSPGTDPLAVAFLGSFAGRSESESLVRVLLRLFDFCRPEPARPEKPVEKGRSKWRLRVPEGFVFAQSPIMQRIYEMMENLAAADLPVLIMGDTGVGKEYLAKTLHLSSPRNQKPFVAINCAAIPADLLEAELFGIGEGVATGVTARKGRFQLAEGGSLFLDEIGDMSADLQAKLLRALQEKEIHPLGLSPVQVDVRVLAATNQELTERIRRGEFRSDLYYRLAGYVLEVPPLSVRPEDVPDLVEHSLRKYSQSLGKSIRGLTVRALRMLVDFPWPGNIRELENEVRRLVYLCSEGQAIESSHLSKMIREHPRSTAIDTPMTAEPPLPTPTLDSDGLTHLENLQLADIESQVIREALRRSKGNQVQAAKSLGISRQKLRRRMESFGLLKTSNT